MFVVAAILVAEWLRPLSSRTLNCISLLCSQNLALVIYETSQVLLAGGQGGFLGGGGVVSRFRRLTLVKMREIISTGHLTLVKMSEIISTGRNPRPPPPPTLQMFGVAVTVKINEQQHDKTDKMACVPSED